MHAAHAQQFLGAAAAAAAPMPPYGYAYYSHNVIPGTFPVFTNPPTQVRRFDFHPPTHGRSYSRNLPSLEILRVVLVGKAGHCTGQWTQFFVSTT